MNLTALKSHQAKLITLLNVVLGAAILVSMIFFVRTLSGIVPPKSERHMSALSAKSLSQRESGIPAYDAIIRNNPFGVPAGSLKSQSSGAEAASVPDIKLTGTISGALKKSYAVFINTDGTQAMFRAGEQVFGVGELVSVEKNSAYIRKGGKLIKIPFIDLMSPGSIEASRGAPAPSGFVRSSGKGEYLLDQKGLQFALDNPNQIMTDAKLIPNMINNKQDGFVLREVRENGLYNRLGMRNGDVLLRINGSDISNPENAFQAFMALKGLNKVQLDLIREGNRITQNYLIR